MVNKALPIVEALYLGYSLFFLFDNMTNYFVFAQNTLYIIQINKKTGRQ